LEKGDYKLNTCTLNRIIIAGGGTGGHLFPGIAIAEAFLALNSRNAVLFVSTANTFERETLGRIGLPLAKVSAEGFKGRSVWKKLKSLLKLPKGFLESLLILGRFKPQMIVGMGSYSAAAVVLAGWLIRKKIVLHEQNILPGITNRLLSQFADRIYLSFKETPFAAPADKIKVSGNPLRSQLIEEVKRQKNSDRDFAAQKHFRVLIMGGSQGAHAINVAMIEALEFLKEPQHLFFIHQTGRLDLKKVSESYRSKRIAAEVKSFFNNMAKCYALADLIICRSGATTVAEITALGKVALLIPYPYAADNHQVLNAQSMVKGQAAEMIPEADLSGALLAERIEYYAANPELLDNMAANAHKLGYPEAAQYIVKDCCQLMERN
jgi:UDP-N-acetylglucosamine--N-acetylmuramyl-(pentapeptide) pyrophosphoryl-undecaprenol N-acetylglucosamine transferase